DGVGGVNPLADDQWGFVVFTSDAAAGTRTVYVNGNAIGSGAYSTTANSPDSFAIGGGVWNPLASLNDLFTGQIDEVALFNKSLSAGQILSLWLRASGGTAQSPVVTTLPGGSGSAALVAADFGTGDGGFTVETPEPSDQTDWIYEGGLWRSNGQADGFGTDNTSFLTSPVCTVAQPGIVSLTFSHHYSFEQGRYDGGVVAVSLNDGDFQILPATAFSTGGYNGVVLGGSDARLASRPAFVENSTGHPAFLASTCVLGYAGAGDKVRVRFISSSDNNTSGNLTPQGWEITGFSLTQGGTGAATVSWPVGVLQRTADPAGIWADVAGNDPLLIDTAANPRLFFRIKP
ncbi:MAG: LamG domain-containing protein, partial [Verrucomicrobiaceae bacterium]